MGECDLDACFTAIVDIAKEAGVTIRDAFYREKRVETKSCAADLVTETDQKVEKFIISSIKNKFPTHSFIGEESVAAGLKCNHTDDPTWIIDPIDGTTNFVHGFPYTCISVALTVNKVTEIGLVYNPIFEDLYTARRSQGAFLNGKPIHVTDTEDLDKSLICTEFGSSRNAEVIENKSKGMNNVIHKAHGIRAVGSAALDLCLVAVGSVDGYFQEGIHCWDYAAGELIVREAGGVSMDTYGSAALDLCLVAVGSVDGYFQEGIHCWDYAAGELIVREAGGVSIDTYDLLSLSVIPTVDFGVFLLRGLCSWLDLARNKLGLYHFGGEAQITSIEESKILTVTTHLDVQDSIRSLGSCAMAMALIAAGSADAYYESGIHVWDMAAGILLVQEAGGVCFDTNGGPVDLMSRRILCAGTEKLANQLVQCMVHTEYERD